MWASEKTRLCRRCNSPFLLKSAADANRQLCSQKCAKAQSTKIVKAWLDDHPEAMAQYNRQRVFKNPGYWREKARAERLESLQLLGGKCVVCGVTNPSWLHVDYIPTTRDKAYRHPRGIAYIRRNMADFRILCANHHYELTLTRRIEGTDITQ
jgi:hypothetical protein